MGSEPARTMLRCAGRARKGAFVATIYGTNGDDHLDGTDDADTIRGLAGDDLLHGREGDDDIRGGAGDDELKGEEGDDGLDGGLGDDVIKGGHGDDLLLGGDGDDVLEGDEGDDILHGGDGDDKLDGGKGDDTLYGGDGNDELEGGKGDDTLVWRGDDNAGSDDFYDGGRDDDTLVLALTPMQAADPVLQSQIAAFRARSPSDTSPFEFTTLHLVVQEVEHLEVVTLSGTQPPVAGDNTLSVTEDGSGSVDLLANDHDPDGTALTVTQIDTTGLVGQLIDNGDGTVTYHTAGWFEHLGAGESAKQTFSYTVTDGDGETASANVTVTIDGVNDAPVAPLETLVLPASDEGVPRGVFYAHLLRGVTDADGDRVSFEEVVASNVDYRLGPSGIVFRPGADDDTEVTFTVRIGDGNGGTTTRTATFDLTPVNDAPQGPATVALPAGVEDVNQVIAGADLLAGMSDVDGDTLAVENLTVSSGRILDNEDGTFTYDPSSDRNGTVTFSYDVSDGTTSVARQATLDLAPVNDAPELAIAYGDFTRFQRDGVGHTTTTVTFTADDDDGDPVTLDLAPGGIAYGDVAVPASFLDTSFDAATGALTITYSDDMRADIVFAVRATDASGAFVERGGWVVSGDEIDLAAGEARIDAARPEFLHGSEAGERLVGGGGRDFIYGHGGDDVIIDGELGDVLRGGEGDDLVFAKGGDDAVYGDAGDDALYGQAGEDYMVGGAGGDELRGGAGDDDVFGGLGDDLVVGDAGADALHGDEGDDRLYGNAGDDALYGGAGADLLFGGLGDDRLSGGDGADTLYGGAGADTFRLTGDEGHAGIDAIADYRRGIDTLELDITRPGGEVVPLTRGEVLASETFDGSTYTYSFGDASFTTQVAVLASDIEIV